VSEAETIKAIRRTVKQRERADILRAEANRRLRDLARQAQSEGVSITQIAQEAHLSRQGLYDLLADPRSV
jgi:hypothetical protein